MIKKPFTLRRLFVLPIVLALWSIPSADAFEIAVGDSQGPSYGLGIGISSLVKVKLLPEAGIDLNPVITTDDQASLDAISTGSVDFALVAVDASQLVAAPDLRALATMGKHGSFAKTLLARGDVDDASIQSILEVVFSNIDFLTAIDPKLTDLDPDNAVMGLTLPLHMGAKRFYATWWASPESEAASDSAPATRAAAVADDEDRAAAPLAPTVGGRAADARNYVLYFGFDDASLNSVAQATLREAATFAGTLDAPAIIVAAYTDSVGDAEYNYLLAERRAGSVMEGLNALGVRYSRIDQSLFGERSPWAVTLDGVSEANNRRVELFIEEPIPELQPLPASAASESAAPAGSHPTSTESSIIRDATPKPAGGPEQRIQPSGKTRRLM